MTQPTPPADLIRLREVWTALGCDHNPNDFHTSVQHTMWTQALSMIRDATTRTSRVYRENQQLEEALRVARTAPATSPVDPEPVATTVREVVEQMDEALAGYDAFAAAELESTNYHWADSPVVAALRRARELLTTPLTALTLAHTVGDTITPEDARAAAGITAPRRRLRSCVENWPDAATGEYNPACCRFPKSCSATVYRDEYITDEQLEPRSDA